MESNLLLRAALSLLAVLPIACDGRTRSGAHTTAPNVDVVVGGDTVRSTTIRGYLADAIGFTSRGGQVFCSYELLGQQEREVYVWALCEEMVQAADTTGVRSGIASPLALTIAAGGSIEGHRRPRDGGNYSSDLDAMFPPAIRDAVHRARTANHELQSLNRAAARGQSE